MTNNSFANTKKKIINHMRNDNWDDILKMITNNEFDLNKSIVNDNNIFHLACIKGKTTIMKQIIDLKNNKMISINLNLGNKDGLPGLHLYYKYGGDDLSFMDYNEICYLDGNGMTVAKYIIDNIEMMNIFIDMIIKHDCVDNLEMIDNRDTKLDKYYILYEITSRVANFAKSKKNKMRDEYLNLLRKLYNITTKKHLVFMAIYLDSIDVIKFLIEQNFDFINVRNGNGSSPIYMAVDYSRHEIADMILNHISNKYGNYETYHIIHKYAKYTHERPIFIAINNHDHVMIEILIKYMKKYLDDYYDQNKVFLMFDQIDRFQNLYIHRLIDTYTINISDDILHFFLKHSDLNHPNYAGNTTAHLIFSMGIWKALYDNLVGRTIDLLIADANGNNCYSYISIDDRKLFMDLTKTIKIPITKKHAEKYTKKYDIKNMIETGTDDTEKSRNYGLFNANSIHYMLYLRYIENKYNNLFIPKFTYDQEEHSREKLFNQLTQYSTSNVIAIFNRYVGLYIDFFYSYHAHIICWFDEDQYYISHKLQKILSDHNAIYDINEERFVILKITLILQDDEPILHANCLIYDRKKKEAWRFEPYGVSNINNSKITIDYHLEKLLVSVYGTITYHDPESYLFGLQFQLIGREEQKKNQNLGDPGGYCLAWTIWFIDTVLSNPDDNVSDIMKNFFDREVIDDIISREEVSKYAHPDVNSGIIKIQSTNHYLDFIRRYAHKLDKEKNKILQSVGIKKYDIYRLVPDVQTENIIMDLFTVRNSIKKII